MPDATPAKKKRIRRSPQQKQLEALTAVVAVLTPLTYEQRRRVWASATALLTGESTSSATDTVARSSTE